jgi:hypothetical protein
MFHSEAFLLWALVVTGFLVVFIPTRTAINQYCQDIACYRAAEISVGSGLLEAWPVRLGASFFPIPQGSQIDMLVQLRNSPEFLLLALAAAGIAYIALTRTVMSHEDDEFGRRARLPMALIGAYFASVLFFATLLSALSGGVQDKGVDPSPWRETGFSWIAWAVILAVVLTAVYDQLYERAALVLSLLLVVFVAVTSILNQADMASVNSRSDTRLYNETALLLVNLDDTPEGNARRCAAIQELRDFAPNESELRKMNLIGTYVNSAAENIYGTVFCDPESS